MAPPGGMKKSSENGTGKWEPLSAAAISCLTLARTGQPGSELFTDRGQGWEYRSWGVSTSLWRGVAAWLNIHPALGNKCQRLEHLNAVAPPPSEKMQDTILTKEAFGC